MSLRILKSFFLIGVILISACSGTSRVRYDSPEEAFTKGMKAYEDERFRTAAEYFQGVFDFGRTHEWAAESQLFLARAYGGDRQYLLAANEYGRFIQIYRNDERIPEAEFELAETYLDRSPEFDLDQNPTVDAITQFQLFIRRNPDNILAPQAQKRILELREKLAHKQFQVAQQYERREMFKASALSYETVFDQYYDSEYADDALLGAMRMYLAYARQSIRASQEIRLEKAVESYTRLIQIFPDSPVLDEALFIYREVVKELGLDSESS